MRHAVVPSHMYAPQLCIVGAHEPLPQAAVVSVDDRLGHEGVAQEVPSAYFSQLPRPSHLPFVEQAVEPLSAQACLGSTVSAATGQQAPACPATLQARHDPQAVGLSQQTPSMQWFEPPH